MIFVRFDSTKDQTMKQAFISILSISLILYSCNSETTEPENETPETTTTENEHNDSTLLLAKKFLITPTSIGQFKIMEPFEKTDAILEWQKPADMPGNPAPFFYYAPADTLCFIQLDYDEAQGQYTDNVARLYTFSDLYKTTDNLGVGSTAKEIMDQYPGSFLIIDHFMNEVAVIVKDDYTLRFGFSIFDYVSELDFSEIAPHETIDMNLLHKMAKVTSVTVQKGY